MEQLEEGGSYSICLSSTACSNVFSNNSTEDFTNTLPFPLKFKDAGRKFYIRLKMVGVCTYEPKTPLTAIRIHISELEPQREGLQYNQCAGTITFPPTEEHAENFGVHVFKDPPTLPLRVVEVNKFHIRLTNEFNQPINLASGAPTIVWIELTAMAEQQNFTVSCISLQPDCFPSNTLTNFNSPLPKELNLDGYEVALQHVIYPQALHADLIAWVRLDKETWYFDLSKYNTFLDLAVELNEKLKRAKRKGVRFYENESFNNWYGFRSYHVTRNQREPRITFSPNFGVACGMSDYPNMVRVGQMGSWFLLGAPPKGKDGPIQMNAPVVLVECDIIKSNVLGGRTGQLLHCVPALTNPNLNRHRRLYEPPTLIFHPVTDKPITRIGIRFTSETGKQLEFFSPNSNLDIVIVALLFRKIKKE